MGTCKDENIHDKIKEVIDALVEQGFDDREFTAGELITLIQERTDIREDGSIMPRDYCYNRVNKGIAAGNTFDVVRPRLLHYEEYGVYRCIGSNKPYTGIVKARPKGEKSDTIVGEWIKGEFFPNEKWEELYGK